MIPERPGTLLSYAVFFKQRLDGRQQKCTLRGLPAATKELNGLVMTAAMSS